MVSPGDIKPVSTVISIKISILNNSDKNVLNFKRLFYVQGTEV